MAYADYADVEQVFRPLTDAERVIVPNLIEQASRKLRVHVPLIDVLIRDADKADLARDAIVNAVKRVLINPEGIRQTSWTEGPYSESKTVDATMSSGQLYIDPDDLIGLKPVPQTRRIRSFKVKSGMQQHHGPIRRRPPQVPPWYLGL